MTPGPQTKRFNQSFESGGPAGLQSASMMPRPEQRTGLFPTPGPGKTPASGNSLASAPGSGPTQGTNPDAGPTCGDAVLPGNGTAGNDHGAGSTAAAASPTRQALLEAAERLFSTRGYSDVGIREIAEIAGANVAAISYHFGSKRELYIETVRNAMIRSGQTAWKLLEDSSPGDRVEAAALLVRFVRRFLSHMLPPKGIDPCGTLIIREGLQPSEALDAVVQHNIRPNESAMARLLGAIAPEIAADELCWYAASVLGQLTHYRVFRPIIEQLRGESLASPARLARLADHIATFTLRGLGGDESLISRAFARAAEDDAHEHESQESTSA